MKPDETLLSWWLDELDHDEAAEVEAHLFECDDCGARLRELLKLRDAVKREFLAGHLSSAVSGAFVRRLKDDGLRVREYAVAPAGGVACTVAPDDDLVVARLRADLDGVRQLDVEFIDAGGVHRSSHVPFDAARREVTLVAPTVMLKSLPKSTQVMRLLAVTRDSERLVGEYTFNHTPWEM